jgi:glutamine synthetase
MHTQQSLWKEGKNLFYEKGGYADLSQACLYYIGGILKHAPALCALIAPTTNFSRRLVPGYEAPINLAYSNLDRCALDEGSIGKRRGASRRIVVAC